MTTETTTELLVRLIDEWLDFLNNNESATSSKEKTFMNFYYWLKNIQKSN